VASLEKDLRTTRKDLQTMQTSKRQLELSLADAQKIIKSKNPTDTVTRQANDKLLKELEQERRAVQGQFIVMQLVFPVCFLGGLRLMVLLLLLCLDFHQPSRSVRLLS